ncbi:MAG: capsular polysaccharide synthesis protein [Pedobacter sp.]|uniref:capsular polysaccharide synthesis protein n=1 Tax=Pedobacter sp. TaxID=1411316 RepID=UPI002807DAA0|nr:capsular polysaccharide synthesis protein [Pedobacter sp.]MDQ8004538.1 capsular polysaccharide synthesis protein [Pedobacter sp.]
MVIQTVLRSWRNGSNRKNMSKQQSHFDLKSIPNKVWGLIRNQIVARKHGRVVKFWQPLITDYFEGKIKKNSLRAKQQISKKVIWQYWGQLNDGSPLPAVVQRCFDSVDKYKGDYQVVRLNDSNIREYLDFPDFVWKTEDETKFSKVFFSDLLRLALLHVYGGVWLDATILLTAPLPEKFSNQDYFVFQRSDDEPNKSFWAGPHTSYWSWDPRYRVKMLNSIIFAKKGSVLIATMVDLILHYWKTQDQIINYFFFQILYDELVNGELKNLKCTVVSDTLPHVLRVLVDGNDYMPLADLLKKVNMHKLTYFEDKRIAELDKLLTLADVKDQH